MTFHEAIARLGIDKVCLGGCGLSPRAHRGVIDGFDVIHFRSRRFTRRGLRRLLLLVARRERLAFPAEDLTAPVRGWANHPTYVSYHLWWEEQRANELASLLGVRFPVAYSMRERQKAWLYLGGKSRQWPAVQAWAIRGMA